MKKLLILILLLVCRCSVGQVSNRHDNSNLASVRNQILPYWPTPGWLNPQNVLNQYFNNPTVSIASTSITLGPTATGFVAGVLLPSGKVLMVPFAATVLKIYDPASTTLLLGPAATGYSAGVLTKSGKVVLIPFSATTIKIYDPDTNTATVGPAATGFWGGVGLPDDTVLMVPLGAAAIKIYDPSTNTVKTGPTATAYAGAAISGTKVILSPQDATQVGIYNVTTKILTGVAGTYHDGAVLMNNGKICFPPFYIAKTSVMVFNPKDNSYTAAASISGTFVSGCLLPDGKILMSPNGATNIKIYDPASTTVAIGPAATGYAGAILMPSGDVMLFPNVATSIAIYHPASATIPLRILLSPWFNKF